MKRVHQRQSDLSLRLYRVLANLFPHEFKNLYGRELLESAEDSVRLWEQEGIVGAIRLLIDVAVRLPAEYAAEIRQDFFYGLRSLRNSPGFTAVALVSLTLGICIATCAISEMNGIVLRTLPEVSHPGQLVSLLAPTSYPNYERYRRQTDLFTSVGAYVAPVPFAVNIGGKTQRSWGQLVSPSYFSTFEVPPFLGRMFDVAEEQTGREPTVVVSYRFWQQYLGADPALVGKTLTVNGHPATLIGVAPDQFLGASPTLFPADLWMPMSVGPAVAPELSDDALHRRDVALCRVVGRLRPGMSQRHAEAELDAITQQLQQENGEEGRDRKGRRLQLVEGGKMLPLRKEDQPFFVSFLILMAGLVVVIACSNVANMMLARATDRRREIAVRLSLGASRARLIRQLLTENMILACDAGTIGFLLSIWLMHLLSQLQMPFPMPVAFDLRPDGRVLLFSLVITLSTGLLFGLAPAWQATGADITPALKEGGNVRFKRLRGLSLRNLFMIAQVAGSLALLMVLGFMSFGIQRTMGIQEGLNAQNLSLISLDPIRDGYPPDRVPDFFRTLLNRLQRLPSITAACLTESIPVSLASQSVSVSVPLAGSHDFYVLDSVAKYVVGKDYFRTTEIPIRFGRSFGQQDEDHDTQAVIVSETFARELWVREDAVGQRIQIGRGALIPPRILPGSFDYRSQTEPTRRSTYEVVGVAGDVAEGLVVQKPRPQAYFPLREADYDRPSLEGVTVIARALPGSDAIDAVQREVEKLSSKITPFNAQTLQEHTDRFMSPLRMAAWTYGCIGIFGLILASVGLAGTTAYTVRRRRQEIAVRMAFGAGRNDVLRLIIRESVLLLAIGTSIGMAFAWAGERALTAASSTVGMVNSTSTSNPTVLVGAPLLLATLAVLACYFPACRSTRVNPVAALRHE